MSNQKTLLRMLAISFSVVILSGCSKNGGTAKEIVESLEQKNYFTAKETFEEAIDELTKEEQEKLNSIVSESVKEYLDKSFTEIQLDSDKERSFYKSLDKIKQIGIDNKELDAKIEYFEREADKAERLTSESDTEVVADSGDNDFEIRFKYERIIVDEYIELIGLWDEVDKGNWRLNQLGYQRSVQELSQRLLNHINFYRKNITIPEGKADAYELYFGYLDEVEQAMTKLDKASYSNLPDLFDEVRVHILSASDYHDSFTISASDS